MRKLIALLPLLAVAACGGSGPETIGGTAAPTGSAAVPVNGGSGSAVTPGSGGTNGAPATGTTFLSITSAKTFDLLGGAHSLSVSDTGGVLYAGNATTVRAPSGTVSFDPRDGIFTVKLADTKAIVSSDLRFQDPAHRIDFSSSGSPQFGVPDLQGFNYLESIGTSVDDQYTFFYQRPGTSTVYVSLAGYVRNNVPAAGGTTTYERGAFAFGDQTARSQVPLTGTGTYRGSFLASMVGAPGTSGSTFQWMQGSSALNVDFGKGTVGVAFNGTVNVANVRGAAGTPRIVSGSTFAATATAAIDLVKTGGFAGQFQSAAFTNPTTGAVTPVDFAAISPGSSTAGASSIDGTFYGPDAVNVGGSFRIIGGIPDQRVDILGAFNGAKQ